MEKLLELISVTGIQRPEVERELLVHSGDCDCSPDPDDCSNPNDCDCNCGP